MDRFCDSFLLHIFLKTLGVLDLLGRSVCAPASFARYFEYIGAEVPPRGPLILLLSVIFLEKLDIYKMCYHPSINYEN